MGPLAAVERFLERLFERQSARLFRTAIRPVQVLRRLERTMEGDRVRDGSRTIVPHRFVVRLHPGDFDALRTTAPELAAALADGALAFARAHGYTILDRPMVALRPDTSVGSGDIVVDVTPASGVVPASEVARARAAPGVDEPAHAGRQEEGPDGATGGDDEASLGPSGDRTAVFVAPHVDGPRASIREIRPDQSSRTVTFDGRPMRIGRAPDNDLVLRDGRASRHHARIDGRRGSLVLSDLASTNGSFVNDRRVASIALGEGDRIRIGTTTLLVETIADRGDPDRGGASPSPARSASDGADDPGIGPDVGAR